MRLDEKKRKVKPVGDDVVIINPPVKVPPTKDVGAGIGESFIAELTASKLSRSTARDRIARAISLISQDPEKFLESFNVAPGNV